MVSDDYRTWLSILGMRLILFSVPSVQNNLKDVLQSPGWDFHSMTLRVCVVCLHNAHGVTRMHLKTCSCSLWAAVQDTERQTRCDIAQIACKKSGNLKIWSFPKTTSPFREKFWSRVWEKVGLIWTEVRDKFNLSHLECFQETLFLFCHFQWITRPKFPW